MKTRRSLIMLTVASLWFCASFLVFAQRSDESSVIHLQNLEKFSPEDQSKIRQWMNLVVRANDTTVGRLPFPIEVYFYSRAGKEPVPWANTWRDGGASVHMYIDARYGLQKFVEDWTAYHELSHFILPYLGTENRWFAEGFASFMQYQYMARIGIISGDGNAQYQHKLKPFLPQFQIGEPPLDMIQNLFQKRSYKPAYWASAWFFIQADIELKRVGKSLVELVSEYLKCCRLNDTNFDDVIKDWDKLAGTPLFSKKLQQWKARPAEQVFPLQAHW